MPITFYVGSVNPVKVGAVGESLRSYSQFADAHVDGFDIKSGVSEQPMSLEETVRGAVNRARTLYDSYACNYSVGIESGLMTVPYTKTGMMDVCAAVIYDGSEFHIGLSSAFECPRDVTDLIKNQGLDMNQAFNKLGYTNDPKLGNAGGAVGLLTKSRVTRKDYTKQALVMALIHLDK